MFFFILFSGNITYTSPTHAASASAPNVGFTAPSWSPRPFCASRMARSCLSARKPSTLYSGWPCRWWYRCHSFTLPSCGRYVQTPNTSIYSQILLNHIQQQRQLKKVSTATKATTPTKRQADSVPNTPSKGNLKLIDCSQATPVVAHLWPTYLHYILWHWLHSFFLAFILTLLSLSSELHTHEKGLAQRTTILRLK